MIHIFGKSNCSACIKAKEKFKKGKRSLIWKGLWRGENINNFLKNYKELYPKIIELFKIYRLFVLPLDCDSKLRRRIEYTIVKILKDQKGLIGDFQEQDIRYQKPKIDNSPIRIKLQNKFDILGLPDKFIIED